MAGQMNSQSNYDIKTLIIAAYPQFRKSDGKHRFSSFNVDVPSQLKSYGYDTIQYTLVDCPGHASLIRTIIGGAQIIDMMLLVVDITKGIQTQTAECLIIGEITCDKMLIVLNKIDLVDEAKRQTTIEKMAKRLQKTLENTKFSACEIIALAASPQQSNDTHGEITTKPMNVDSLIEKLKELTFVPVRSAIGPFLFAVDHCFNIKGQGTVMTGTILSGQIKLNETIEIPVLKVQKKVKSIQMFRKPIEQAIQGDRCGICVTNFDAKLIERGLACTPDYIRNVYGIIIELNKIRHFKGNIENGAKFHITIGHETLIGKIELFADTSDPATSKADKFDFNKEYCFVDQFESATTTDDATNKASQSKINRYYLLIDFIETNASHPVLCAPNSVLIGSKLDTDIHLNQCRIAFYGHVLHAFTDKDYRNELVKLKVFKEKFKEGVVERMVDAYTVIGKSLFKKETNLDLFVGLKVTLSSGELGFIEGNFGQSGKFKIRIPNGLASETQSLLSGQAKTKKKTSTEAPASDSLPSGMGGSIKVSLKFKKYVHDMDHTKKLTQ